MKKEFDIEKTYAVRLPHDGDLLDELNKFCLDNDIYNGAMSVIGAVKCAKLGFYEQDTHKYVDVNFDGNQTFEIVNASGNVSIKDEKPFVHMHVIVADKDGKCFAGHLLQGTKIFAGEAIIQKFNGNSDLVREFDEVTKLSLWK